MINTAITMGRLTADPELRHTPQGIFVTRFTVAVDRSYQKAGTERQTDFIDVVCWCNTAEFVSKYFRKGSMIAVEGSIQTGSYEKDGIRRRTFEVVVRHVSFCGRKVNTKQPEQEHATKREEWHGNASYEDFEELEYTDDDLPF